MSRYSKEHYEDVARILSKDARTVEIVTEDIARDFADLFAADNPPTCRWGSRHHVGPCDLGGGFNREKFLTACGLEPADCPICHGPSDGHTHPRQDSKGES